MAKIIIHKKNLINNLKIITQHIKNIDKVAVVLKDNAYGHGLLEIASIASSYGIKKAVVRYKEEALPIYTLFEDIIILSGNDKEVNPKLSFAINSLEDIKKTPPGCLIELKVDTGMHRNGIAMEELNIALKEIVTKKLILKGVFTHNKEGDELSSLLFWQKQNFLNVKQAIKKFCTENGLDKPRFHSLSSSGVFRTKNIEDDFVRVGIAMYGYLEWESVFGEIGLLPVMELKASKVSTRKLKKGSAIGYGSAFRCTKDTVISSYDIGYGDGFFRASEAIKASIEDGREILGRVSMDYLSLEGNDEEVTLFKDAKRFAKQFKTISYDITTKLSTTIKREIV